MVIIKNITICLNRSLKLDFVLVYSEAYKPTGFWTQ